MPERNTSSTQRKSKYKWVLYLENWHGFVIIHIPQLNVTPVEDNYVNLSVKEIKNTCFQHSHPKRSCQKRSE